ncbi:50S ribosomal protein L22 [Candidatus Woesearchaeota archaeon]|nr:50S ribosomal protein L22 [Candidatus Woesearchaeota archaeon]
MPYKYASKNYEPEHMAKAVGTSLSISTKHAIEICTLLRHKELSNAKGLLKNAIEKKQAIPFSRFNSDVGHKKVVGPGRYPEKASEEVLKLLECVEANAQFKGLNTAELIIEHICAHKAGKVMRYGRQRGRTSKRTHVEVMVKEIAKKEKPKEKKATEKKEEKKPEIKAPKEAKPSEKAEKKEVVKKAEEKKPEEVKAKND